MLNNEILARKELTGKIDKGKDSERIRGRQIDREKREIIRKFEIEGVVRKIDKRI